MKIEIKNTNTKNASTLITKFLELNDSCSYDYFDKDNIFVGYNNDSGYSYIYLENNPSVSLCLSDFKKEIEIIYSSGLDGLEFVITLDDSGVSNLEELETLLNNAYCLEDEIRGDNYEDDELKDSFIEAMESKNWELL